MRVAFVQLKPEFGRIKDNVEKALSMMKSEPADLYVLPELFATGYVFVSKDELAGLAEKADGGYTGRSISDFARTEKTAVVYGFAEKSAEGIFNSCAFIDGDGNFKLYRKIHLFFNEKRLFAPGNLPLEVFRYRNAGLGMMICFDWIFPEFARSLALMKADLICHPANLVMPYCQDAMVTRSIENRIFTITANRIGQENRHDISCKFTGMSQITDCRGHVIYRAANDKEEVGTADIKIEDARDKDINIYNNIWKDRRVEYYRLLGEK